MTKFSFNYNIPSGKIPCTRLLQNTRIMDHSVVFSENFQFWKSKLMLQGGILTPGSLRILINQTLVLQKITKQSNGNYCCVASNEEGESQSEPFYLNVQCKYHTYVD